MTDNGSYLVAIHRYSFRNRALIEGSSKCGCFYCLAVFPATAVNDWTDDESTALCPHCSIDSVLPDKMPEAQLSPHILAAMKEYWFDREP